MATLLIKLAGPLQAWGSDSRFSERKTEHQPTKSGVIGLLAAALGRRRTEDISDLAALTFGVRIDSPGLLERDYQSAHTRKYDAKQEKWVFDKTMPLSNRYYLVDAVFVAGLEGNPTLLEDCAYALDHPAFPLYLGRRSCPPTERIFLSFEQDKDLMDALSDWPWEASKREAARRSSEQTIQLEVVRDELARDSGDKLHFNLRDVPISFSQEHRLYGPRTVVYDTISVPNPYATPLHDPMAAVEEVAQ